MVAPRQLRSVVAMLAATTLGIGVAPGARAALADEPRPAVADSGPPVTASAPWRMFWNDDEFLLADRVARTQAGVRARTPLGEIRIALERFRELESTRSGRTVLERPGALPETPIGLPSSMIPPVAGVLRLELESPSTAQDPGTAEPTGPARFELTAGGTTLLSVVLRPNERSVVVESGTVLCFQIAARRAPGPGLLEIRYQPGRGDVYWDGGLIGGWRRFAPPPAGFVARSAAAGPVSDERARGWKNLVWTSIARGESPHFDHPADWRIAEFDGSVWLGHWPPAAEAGGPGSSDLLDGDFRLIGPGATPLRIPRSAVRLLRAPVRRPATASAGNASAAEWTEIRGPRWAIDLGELGRLEAPGERTPNGDMSLRHSALGSIRVPAPLIRNASPGRSERVLELDRDTVHLGVTAVEPFRSIEPLGTLWNAALPKGPAGRLIVSLRTAESPDSTDTTPIGPGHLPVQVTFDGREPGPPESLPTLDGPLPDAGRRFQRLRLGWSVPARPEPMKLSIRLNQREGRPPSRSVELTRVIVETSP